MNISKVDNTLRMLFANPKTSVLITMFLVFYGGLAGPDLPEIILNLFNNPVFRVFILSLIAYKGNNDPKLSILVSICFVVSMDILNKKKLFENFSNDTKMLKSIEKFSENEDPHFYDLTNLEKMNIIKKYNNIINLFGNYEGNKFILDREKCNPITTSLSFRRLAKPFITSLYNEIHDEEIKDRTKRRIIINNVTTALNDPQNSLHEEIKFLRNEAILWFVIQRTLNYYNVALKNKMKEDGAVVWDIKTVHNLDQFCNDLDGVINKLNNDEDLNETEQSIYDEFNKSFKFRCKLCLFDEDPCEVKRIEYN